MSDEKLRQLERRWRKTGSVADESAWLRERVRVGNLEPERLRLAAYLGHEPARIAAPQAIGDFARRLRVSGGSVKETLNCYEHPPSGVLAEWSAILPKESKDVCVRLAIAACRAALLACSDPVILTWSNEVLAAMERWLIEPRTPDSLRTLAKYWWSHTRNHPRSSEPSASAIGWAIMNAQILSSYDPEGVGNAPDDQDEFEEFCKESAENRAFLGDVFAGAQHALGVERTPAIEAMVREEIVPWLLGHGDPVAERVCARAVRPTRSKRAGVKPARRTKRR